MPIKELLALTILILSGLFVAHPLDFSNAVRRVELSILKQASRTDDWGDPSFSGARKSIRAHHSEQRRQARVHENFPTPHI